jgi:outer membrane protein assembly factor BamB
VEGQWYQASTVGGVPNEPNTGAIVALDPSTGATRWRFPMVSTPSVGVLSTAGGLVFTGDAEGYVIALDAHSGKVLWKFYAGERVIGPPVSYLVDGRQYLGVAAGGSYFTFGH